MSAEPEVSAGMANMTPTTDRLKDRRIGRRPRARRRMVKHVVLLAHRWSSLLLGPLLLDVTGRHGNEPG